MCVCVCVCVCVRVCVCVLREKFMESIISNGQQRLSLLMGVGRRRSQHSLFSLKDFIYLFDRERDSQKEREHKQGEWERKKQASNRGPLCEARSQDSGITP